MLEAQLPAGLVGLRTPDGCGVAAYAREAGSTIDLRALFSIAPADTRYAFRLRLTKISTQYEVVFDEERIAIYWFSKASGRVLIDTTASLIPLELAARAHGEDQHALQELRDRFSAEVNPALLAPFVEDDRFYALPKPVELGDPGLDSLKRIPLLRGDAPTFLRLCRAVAGYVHLDFVAFFVIGVMPDGSGNPGLGTSSEDMDDFPVVNALASWVLINVVTPVLWRAVGDERGRLVQPGISSVRYYSRANSRTPRERIVAQRDLHELVREHGGDPAAIIAAATPAVA
jgi:hypothetical protein